jgi:hypothetical protein
MKHITGLACLFLMGGMLMLTSGCATNAFPGGPTVAGVVYTEVTSPAQYLSVALDKDAQPLKKGEASNMAFLGLFAFGDAGINAAMQNGGIKKVRHVDHTVQHFLYAIFARNKTIVYGE